MSKITIPALILLAATLGLSVARAQRAPDLVPHPFSITRSIRPWMP